MAASDRRVGDRVGRYTLESPLGSGGFATVWVARDDEGAGAVIKVLRPEVALEAKARERFAREVEVLAELSHPGIVRLVGHDLAASPPYFVMERVVGQALRDRLIESATMQRPVPVATAVAVVNVLADALAHAHARGVIHRDLKPANVLLDVHERPRILDFGLARLVGVERHAATTLGRVMGTRYYWAPEQAVGDEAGPATDQFALATIAFEVLTLRRAWVRDEGQDGALALHLPVPSEANRPLDILERLRDAARPRASAYVEVGREVDAVLDRAWSVRPADRYLDTRAFARALSAALDPTDHASGETVIGGPRAVSRSEAVAALAPTAVRLTTPRVVEVSVVDPLEVTAPSRERPTRAEATSSAEPVEVTAPSIERGSATSRAYAASPSMRWAWLAGGAAVAVSAVVVVVAIARGDGADVRVVGPSPEPSAEPLAPAEVRPVTAEVIAAPSVVPRAVEPSPSAGTATVGVALAPEGPAPSAVGEGTPPPEAREARSHAGRGRTRARPSVSPSPSPSGAAAEVARDPAGRASARALRARLEVLRRRADLAELGEFADELDALAAQIADPTARARVRRLVVTGAAVGDHERLLRAVGELERAGVLR